MARDSYTARRGAFAQAIEACEELIRDYETAHRDWDGNVTGHDFNALEIEAVKAAIVRIQCIETREVPPTGPCDCDKLREAIDIALALTGYLDSDHPDQWTLQQESKLRAMRPPATTSPIEKEKPCS